MQTSRPTLLVVTTGDQEIAPARMPRELSRAGFAVVLLAPRNALATRTRFVDKLGHFPDQASLAGRIETLAGAVFAVRPAQLLPADDAALELMTGLALDPPAALRRDLQQQLAALIASSLGAPEHYATGVDAAAAPDGERLARVSFAWRGSEVAGFTLAEVERLAPEASPSVVRFVANPEVASASRRLLSERSASGFVRIEYVAARGSAPRPTRIERRMTAVTHLGARVGIDLAAAFAAALAGRDWTGPRDLGPGSEQSLALFPEEWRRDRASPYLSSVPVDVPWDDAALVSAMLAGA